MLAATLSGCATKNYPVPISEPSATATATGGNPPKTTKELLDIYKIHAEFYQATADDKRKKVYQTNDAGIAGGVIGVIGGLAKSVNAAIAGAFITSGTSIYSEHYNLSTQAANYEKASDAIYCMYNTLFINTLSTDSNLDSTELLSSGYESLNTVKRKLRQAQINVQIVAPDLNKLSTAISRATEAEDVVRQRLTENKKSKQNPKAIAKDITKDSDDALNEAILRKTISEIDKCASSF